MHKPVANLLAVVHTVLHCLSLSWSWECAIDTLTACTSNRHSWSFLCLSLMHALKVLSMPFRLRECNRSVAQPPKSLSAHHKKWKNEEWNEEMKLPHVMICSWNRICLIPKPLDNNSLNTKYWTWGYAGQSHLTNSKTNGCYQNSMPCMTFFQLFIYEFWHNCDIKDIGGKF
jgi:hypothetical protein